MSNKKFDLSKKRYTLLLTILCHVLSCTNIGTDRAWNNPFDPDGVNYFPPAVVPGINMIVAVNKPAQLSVDAYDHNGTIAAICWSFDGGLSWDTTWSTNLYLKTWTVHEIGKNSVWYKAIDNDGLVSTLDSLTVDVHVFAPVLQPVPDTVVSQHASVNIDFQAGDTNGIIIRYYWKVLGEGSEWIDSSDTPSASFSHPSGGPQQIVWAAMDDDLNIVSDTFTILYNRGPSSATIVGANASLPFSSFNFNSCTGSINILFTADDPDGAADTLLYTFYLNVHGSPPVPVYAGRDPVFLAEEIPPQTKYDWVLRVTDLFGDSIEISGDFTSAPTPPGPDGMILINSNAKHFQMGQLAFSTSEQPVHAVSFTYHFWIDSTEVTRLAYFTTLNITHETSSNASSPIADISWYDAVLYCNAKSRHAGLDTVYKYSGRTGEPGQKSVLHDITIDMQANGFRLPTEAEWEYACRAGSSTLFYWGNSRIDISEYAWIATNSGNVVHNVASKAPNAFGLYDMSGNVWEWCNDWFNPDYYSISPSENPTGPQQGVERVIRGGSYMHSDYSAQSASRSKLQPDSGNQSIGFRTVLVVK